MARSARDRTAGSSAHTWHHPDGLLSRTVREGGRNVPNLGITSGMPAFGDRLSDDQIVVVIEYSRIFWEPDQRDF